MGPAWGGMSAYCNAAWSRSIPPEVRTTQKLHGDTRLIVDTLRKDSLIKCPGQSGAGGSKSLERPVVPGQVRAVLAWEVALAAGEGVAASRREAAHRDDSRDQRRGVNRAVVDVALADEEHTAGSNDLLAHRGGRRRRRRRQRGGVRRQREHEKALARGIPRKALFGRPLEAEPVSGYVETPFLLRERSAGQDAGDQSRRAEADESS